MRSRLKDLVKQYQFRDVSEVLHDEEHKTYSVTFTDSQGAVRKIDWALASTAESRQMLAKHAQLRDQLQPPFLIEYAAKTSKAEAEEETEEAASEEGVSAEASAPGTVAETKPAKRNSKVSHDPVEKKTAREVNSRLRHRTGQEGISGPALQGPR